MDIDMKKIVVMIVVFWFKSLCVFSQGQGSNVSTYFLLPEGLATEQKGNMWQFDLDNSVMYAKILCPCLKGGEMPILAYHPDRIESRVSEDQIKNIKLINLPDLIMKCKASLEKKDDINYFFYLLEKRGAEYIIHSAKITQTHTVN